MSREHRLLAGAGSDGPMPLRQHRLQFPAPPVPTGRPHVGLIDAVERSGLRGRGGAGFPTGVKLRTVSKAAERPIVLVNGSEGEPASQKDKVLMGTVPHLVLDGALLAALAVGADEVVIAIERRAKAAGRAMQWALQERRGIEPMIPVRFVPVPAHYVIGEETALVHLVNGGPGKPTATPPRPFEKGIEGRPTLVDNVETLAHLAQIAQRGPAWFRGTGTDDEPGTQLVTVSGAVGRKGVYEIGIGTPIVDIVRMAGGAPHGVAGLLLGGYYGAWLGATNAARTPFSNAALRPLGAGVGCGAIVVLPNDACGLHETARVLRWMAGETAGQCGPCVHGLPALAGGMEALAAGKARPEVLAQLERWAGQVEGRGGCKFPDGAVRLLRSALKVFATDVDHHLRGRPCAVDRSWLPIPDTNDEPWQ